MEATAKKSTPKRRPKKAEKIRQNLHRRFDFILGQSPSFADTITMMIREREIAKEKGPELPTSRD